MKNISLQEIIESKVFIVRGVKVMLDKDIAMLYGVSTYRLNEQVKRNKQRFPKDFMFQVTNKEYANLISQIAISSWGGTRKRPFVFTENGVAMLSGVLHSTKAIEAKIQIMRAFTLLRRLIDTHLEVAQKINQLEQKYEHHDFQIQRLFDTVRNIPKINERSPKIKGFSKEK